MCRFNYIALFTTDVEMQLSRIANRFAFSPNPQGRHVSRISKNGFLGGPGVWSRHLSERKGGVGNLMNVATRVRV